MGGWYLGHTFFIDCDAASIKEKSGELTAGIEGEKEKAIRIFYFVRDEIRYDIYSPRSNDADFKASHVLASWRGLLRAEGSAARCAGPCRGYPCPAQICGNPQSPHPPALVEKRGSNLFPYHGLTDLNIDGRWVKATPTYDNGLLCEDGESGPSSSMEKGMPCCRSIPWTEGSTPSIFWTGVFLKISP